MDLPAHEYLDEMGIPYQRRVFPLDTDQGSVHVADAFGYTPGQMVKTLIFETGTDERVLVMVGGDKIAVSSHLKKAVGSRDIKLAVPDVVKELTGYEVGSIPPFLWQPRGFRTFLDASLMQEPVLGVGAGIRGNEIMITPENLVKASGAIVVNLTDKSQAV